jgi:hypothetical protein
MSEAGYIARQLDPKARKGPRGEWAARCPAHDDREASFSIRDHGDKVLFTCFAGCAQRDLADELIRRGLLGSGERRKAFNSKPEVDFSAVINSDTWQQELPAPPDAPAPPASHPRFGKPSMFWTYMSEYGETLNFVYRFDLPSGKKQVLPLSFGSVGGRRGWHWRHLKGERPLYRLDQLAERPEAAVLVVEGEKAADAAAKLFPSYVVTTWQAGSNAVDKAFWQSLEGRRVTIWPDADSAGHKAAGDVASILESIAAGVRIVELPEGLPEKWDLADEPPEGVDVHALLRGAPEPKPELPYTLLRDIKPNLVSNDIVKGLLPRNAFVEVHSVAGGGKTAIITDMVLHVAAGRGYRGRRVERQPVVYVALEGHAGIDNRVIAARDNLGIEDAPFALVKATDNFRDPKASKKVAEVGKAMVRDFGGDCPVVVIDTYTAALGSGGSDCDPKDVSAFIEAIKGHLMVIGCTVLITHHFGKDASRGGRGWSGLNAALDVELEIARSEDLRTMRVAKSRDGSDSQPAMCYRLHAHQVGINNYDEPVTTVAVEHLADEAEASPGKKLSPKARSALSALWDCIKDRSRSHPMPGEPGTKWVTIETWEAACMEPGAVSKSAREADRARQFREAKDELEAAGTIICDGFKGSRIRPAAKRG